MEAICTKNTPFKYLIESLTVLIRTLSPVSSYQMKIKTVI